MANATALIAEAREHVGTGRYSDDKPGRDPVNLPMIHHWVQVFEDRNPVYVDEAAGAATRHGGLVAPPAMLQTWTMDAVNKGDSGGPQDEVLGRLDQAGYTSVVATNYTHEYRRELRLGERVVQRSTIEDMSEEKRTALGPGIFVTTRHDYVTEDGELVGIGRMRLLKFKPPAARPAAPATPQERADDGRPRRPGPAVNQDNAAFWEGVAAGELRIQRCSDCQALRHPPGPMCPDCGSTATDLVVSAGKGTIHSFVVHHHPPLPEVDPPHPVALVDLDEGVRLLAQMVTGTPVDGVAIGRRVAVTFEQINDDLTVPAFRLNGSDR